MDVIDELDEILGDLNSDGERVSDLDQQKLYYNWVKENHNLGSDRKFNAIDGGCWFPNPIRKQTTAQGRKKPWTVLPVGTAFPIPRGDEWSKFVATQHGGNADAESEASCRLLTGV